MKSKNILLAIKVILLLLVGPIIVIGSLGLTIKGGLWACPFPLPFIMCNVCPVYCTFGQVRLWLFYGILATGLVMGRLFCGAGCPLGIAQELVNKVPVPRFTMPRGPDQAFRYLKYVLALLVVGLVVHATGLWTGLPLMGRAWSFLTVHTDEMRVARLLTALIFLIIALFMGRAWCKYLCPFGTWISPFNRFSLVGLSRNPEQCVECGVCERKCSKAKDAGGSEDIWDSIECLRCLQCYTECRGKAFRFKIRLRG
ncbi:MAG TPA: 4Fe-4S binding protein [Dehalococcoidia bacterium]|nr:4Fe-4S binding protein [Dehalococcoidia bacterium]